MAIGTRDCRPWRPPPNYGSKACPCSPCRWAAGLVCPTWSCSALDAPTFGVVGKSVRIAFTIDSSLPRDHVSTVVLRTSRGDTVTKDVHVAAMGRTNDWIAWKPEETGDVTLTLEVPVRTDETRSDNNRLTVPISIRREKLRVLIVESYPRWEYRYLRNALSRDPGVDLSCLLFHPGLGKVGGGNKDYIKQFPRGLDELAPYDVVFLGDVGVGDGQLTEEQCTWLKGMVEHQASGIVFMPGWQGRQFSLLDTELNELYPVVLDDAQKKRMGIAHALSLRAHGGRSPQFADEAGGFRAGERRSLGRPARFSVVCAGRACSGGMPKCLPCMATPKTITADCRLLVTRTYGAGKVLFMGTDGAWRWRKGVEDTYHYRFWGQVVRWMAYQRNMAKGKTMRLYYSPDQPRIGGTVMLSANVMDRSGEPLQHGDVSARITAPSGKAETIGFLSSNEQWGAFAAQIHRPRARQARGRARLQTDRRDARCVFLRPRRSRRAAGTASPAGRARGDRPSDARQVDRGRSAR